MQLKASVIIPSYEEEENISAVLNSLSEQEAEVIVVDSGEDATVDIAENHGAVDKVIDLDEKTLPAGARNKGAEKASNDVLLFTDADTVVGDNWVSKHLSNYEEGVVGVGGPLRPRENSLKHKILFKILSDWWYRVSWPLFPQAAGANCSYLKEEFLEEGGFNEEISLIEDTEMSIRMDSKGEVIYDKTCWVYTSARRQEDTGYLKLFLKFLKTYFGFFRSPKSVEGDYF